MQNSPPRNFQIFYTKSKPSPCCLSCEPHLLSKHNQTPRISCQAGSGIYPTPRVKGGRVGSTLGQGLDLRRGRINLGKDHQPKGQQLWVDSTTNHLVLSRVLPPLSGFCWCPYLQSAISQDKHCPLQVFEIQILLERDHTPNTLYYLLGNFFLSSHISYEKIQSIKKLKEYTVNIHMLIM